MRCEFEARRLFGEPVVFAFVVSCFWISSLWLVIVISSAGAMARAGTGGLPAMETDCSCLVLYAGLVFIPLFMARTGLVIACCVTRATRSVLSADLSKKY